MSHFTGERVARGRSQQTLVPPFSLTSYPPGSLIIQEQQEGDVWLDFSVLASLSCSPKYTQHSAH